MSIPEELLATLVAFLVAPLFVLCHIALFRHRGEDSQGHTHLFMAFGFYAAFWLVCAKTLWGSALSASQIVAGESAVGFICLAYMQVFSQVCRGFSLRLLVEVDRCEKLDLAGIAREYSDGHGVGWLLEKRVAVLEKQHMIARDSDSALLLCPKGRRAGAIGVWLKRVLKPAQGG